MNCFLIPTSLCRALEQVMARFWWRNNGTRKGIHWCTWSSLARPKSCGGLGFRELSTFNVALLAKQGWRLITQPGCFLAKVLKARYYPRNDFLSSVLGSNPSYVWRSIWSAKGLLEQGVGWRIGSGCKVNIWNDSWLPGPGDGRVKRDSININYIHVSDLIHGPSATWRVDVLQALFDEEQVDTICSIPLSRSRKCDEIIWRPDRSGIYSVKSGYRLLRDDLPAITGVTGAPFSHMILQFFNDMWSVNLPAKVKINMWKVANSFLPTYSALQNRSLHVNNVCPFCRNSGETVAHIMRDCSFVTQLFAAQGICFPSCLLYPNWLDWVAVAFCSLNATNKVVMLVTLWAVWYARNKLVHEGTTANVRVTLSFISAFIGVNAVVQTPPSARRIDDAIGWRAPEPNVIKFNFDATYDILSKKSVSGVIGRDHAGLIMASCIVPHLHVADTFVAEALACLQAVTFAKELGFRRVVVEGDSLTVIKKVRSLSADGSLISPIIFDIKDIVKGFDGIAFKFVHRSSNIVAHTLARVGRGHQVPSYWIEEAPPEVTSAAMVDLERLASS
ncbi:hypothetical protein GQ457_01G015730 [Hibiscus cannabinus]